MRRTEESKVFKNAILACIIVSSIMLAFENPLTDPKSDYAKTLMILDIIMTSIFTLEVIIKVISRGFILNGRKSYILSWWNVLDFSIVIIALISLAIPNSSGNLKILKIFRMGRLLRPLRVLSRNEGLKISIQALAMAIPNMMNLMIIVILFFMIFAIMGINLFKGQFQFCNTEKLSLTAD